MEKMFDQMMQGFCNGMSEEDKSRIKGCVEKMAAFCPCGGMQDMSDEDKGAMLKKMTSLCGSRMAMMSALISRGASSPDQPGGMEKV